MSNGLWSHNLTIGHFPSTNENWEKLETEQCIISENVFIEIEKNCQANFTVALFHPPQSEYKKNSLSMSFLIGAFTPIQ